MWLPSWLLAPLPSPRTLHQHPLPCARTGWVSHHIPHAPWAPPTLQVIAIRDAIAPNVKLDADELGVILPNDNDPSAPYFPNIYWSAAGGTYAYLFGKLGVLGMDVLGESQLMGYPQLGNLAPQFPSVSLVNWTNGLGTPRYWVLKLLLDQTEPGDAIVNTTVAASSGNATVYAQAYAAPDGTRKVLLVNKVNAASMVDLSGATGGTLYYVNDSTGDNPYASLTIGSDTFTLDPYTTAFVVMPASAGMAGASVAVVTA
jgi:hypothetical protein